MKKSRFTDSQIMAFLYQYVYADKACGGELYKHLRQWKRRYRRGS